MGFDTLIRFGCNWNYSNTTAKHLYFFLRQNGFFELANKKTIEKAIEYGYIPANQSIAVIYDKTMK